MEYRDTIITGPVRLHLTSPTLISLAVGARRLSLVRFAWHLPTNELINQPTNQLSNRTMNLTHRYLTPLSILCALDMVISTENFLARLFFLIPDNPISRSLVSFPVTSCLNRNVKGRQWKNEKASMITLSVEMALLTAICYWISAILEDLDCMFL
jgi:hypothetical protein